jgi:hypothetical protein
VHGSPRSPWEAIFPITPEDEIEAMLAGIEETTLIAAHSHLAMDRSVGRWHIMNPGTVGVPLDGMVGASYMIVEGSAQGWQPLFRRIPVDDAPLFSEFERQRFVEICGVVGHLVVEEFKTARLRLHPFAQWRNTCCPDQPLSKELLDQFAQADPWDYTPPAYHINVADRRTADDS